MEQKVSCNHSPFSLIFKRSSFLPDEDLDLFLTSNDIFYKKIGTLILEYLLALACACGQI